MNRISVFMALALSLIVSGLNPLTSTASLAVVPKEAAVFSKIELTPNIETVGVIVSGKNLPKTAALMYRRDGEITWRTGHPLVRIEDGRLAGSLFGLSPSAAYSVKVSDGAAEISVSVVTQADELEFQPSVTLYVDDDAAAGGNGSRAKPFRTIQEAVNRAAAGTRVLVADGIYRENVTFPVSGTDGRWIQVKAEGGGAILDGSVNLPAKAWKPYGAETNLWYAAFPTPIKYLARNGLRFYMYDNMKGLTEAVGHNKVPMAEGWYMEPQGARLYVRTLKNPADYSWQAPLLNHAFDVNGRSWIWIEGFEIRYYGAKDGCGVCVKNSSHVAIRRNKIHHVQLGVFVNWNGSDARGSDTRIEYNEIYDPPVNEWAWKAVKGSSMEGTAIVLRGRSGAIVRGNELHHFFNGVYTGSSADLENAAIALDADVYDNFIHHIGDDALEPEGACVNHRFRNNVIRDSLVGVSLAPVTRGPVWVLRSLITNYSGTSFKWDLNSRGAVFIYHNTSWTDAPGLNAMSMLRPVHNSVMRNNIFQGNEFAFEAAFTGASGHDWDYDNWRTARFPGVPRFKWEAKPYDTISDLCAATRLECNGLEDPPGFVNPQGGDFNLLSSSPNIDRGVVLPGINDDFSGSAPDIGAYESEFDRFPVALSVNLTGILPTAAQNVEFEVVFSEPVSGVEEGDFEAAAAGNLSGAFIKSVTGEGAVYRVTVDTGSGDGFLGLQIKDDDSILDSAGSPLGGTGTENGGFLSRNQYVILKSVPIKFTTANFTSNGAFDGWVIEAGEESGRGGGFNSVSPTFYLGDNAEDRQFRAILDFNTAPLPDNAIVVGALLKIKKLSVTGANPFLTHRNIQVDIGGGIFGLPALQEADFESAAGMDLAGVIFDAPQENWYSAALERAALQLINLKGPTQLRLRFQTDDNDNLSADTVKFHSGDSRLPGDRPLLQVEYYAP